MPPAKKSIGRPRNEHLHQAILDAAVDLVHEKGFRNICMDDIAARAKAGRMTLYRRWPNKAAIVMDAFVQRVDHRSLFSPEPDYLDSIRLQMRKLARRFRGKDGVLIRTLLAEASFDSELADAIRDLWTLPRRRMAAAYFRQGIQDGHLRANVDPESMIDLLYAPLYYRLQMNLGPLSDAYVDQVFHHAMQGLAVPK